MTRKDYVMIAQVISESQGLTRSDIIDTVAERLADALAIDNPRFDRARFLAACGVK
jgi:hypothetical protein